MGSSLRSRPVRDLAVSVAIRSVAPQFFAATCNRREHGSQPPFVLPVTSTNSFNLSEEMIRVGLELFRAERSASDKTAQALASALGLPVAAVLKTLAKMADMHLVEARGFQGDASELLKNPAAAFAAAVSAMTPLLPAALEGHLEYSPAADDERVRAILDGADDGAPSEDDVAAAAGIPVVRAREAILRHTRFAGPVGARMRVILEVTFPDLDPNALDARELIERWTRALEASPTAPCRDVKIREMSLIGFVDDPKAYRQWRHDYFAPDPRAETARRMAAGLGGLGVSEE